MDITEQQKHTANIITSWLRTNHFLNGSVTVDDLDLIETKIINELVALNKDTEYLYEDTGGGMALIHER